VGATRDLLQDELRKNIVTAEFDSLIYQVKEYVLTLLADRRYMLHLDNEFTIVKIGPLLFTSSPELGCPGRYDLALQHQQATSAILNARDLQHVTFPSASEKGNQGAKPEARKVKSLQLAVGRSLC
jgi:hypothetical protein